MNARLLTISGLAAETRVPQATLQVWLRKGWIACERDSANRRLFDQATVKKAIEIRKARTQRTEAAA